MKAHTGRCLCGRVRYEVLSELRGIVACHCTQCRRTSGHHVAATSAPSAKLVLTNSEGLVWYRSSESAERGFCGTCGGNLFWRPIGGDTISIMAGTLDTPTHLSIVEHIFVADKSDYYTLNDDLPKKQGWA